ncbi:MAG: DUF5009 domain-containing protein [Alistipes sp.]|jgi:predicted acyltransferase|nr:DUF5009 domain-containing protein [Alistipes sp.]
MEKTTKRLQSLDVLRGFDLFCLVALAPIMYSISRGGAGGEVFRSVTNTLFQHGQWAGFPVWDLVMPLFMFMAGVSMPFSLGKFREMPNKWPVYGKILKRFAILWIFGMLSQGDLLELNPDQIYLYSNTLQSIAVGYLFTALIFLHTRPKTQVFVAGGLLLLYWALMQFVSMDGFGGGDYTADGNLAEGIDRAVLGRFRDGARIEDGAVVFSRGYRYTWVLSSINFVVTVMTGLFSGYIMRSQNRTENRKTLLLLGLGAAMVAAGWLWGLQMPVVKKIWTSSMTLVSSGYCFILMGAFYWWIDVKGHNKNWDLLKVYGMNSIMAYMLQQIIRFTSIGQSLFGGLEQYLGDWYGVLITLTNVTISFLILYWMYRKKVYLRV